MTSTNTIADRTAHARALTTGGIDGLADAALICDLRATIDYASELLADGSALAVADASGWFLDLALTLGRAPSALEVEARHPGGWWVILGHAYEVQGGAGLLVGVSRPASCARSRLSSSRIASHSLWTT